MIRPTLRASTFSRAAFCAALTLGALTLTLTLTPLTARSATTWRCGNAYSDQPCQNGKAVDVSDPRSASDQRAADAMTQRTASNADRMQRERLALEQAAAQRERSVAIANAHLKIEQERAARPKALPKASRKQKAMRPPPAYFTAQGPGTGAKKATKGGSKK